MRVLVVAVALLIAVVAVGHSMLSEYTLVDEKADSVIRNPMGFVLNYVSGEQNTVDFRAELAFEKKQNIDFAFNDNIDSFYVDCKGGPENKIIISGLFLRSASDTHIEFVDYAGSVNLGRKLSFTGSAKRARTDEQTLSKDKFVKVSGKDIEFSKVFLSKLKGQSMVLTNVTGNVEIFMDCDSADIPVNDRRFELSSFDGEIRYYKDHIVIDGSGRLDFGIFKAPSE